MSTSDLIIGYSLGVIILSLIIWNGMALRIGYTQMDLMLSHLRRSSAVTALASLRHGGPWGVLLLVGGIAGFVAFPNFYIKRGTIDADDINNFPDKLKIKLTRLYRIVILLLSCMGILLIIKYSIKLDL